MNVIDAIWDQVISGYKTCEVIFEKGDDYEDYIKAEIENKYQFSVVKIPVGNLKLVHQLEDYGYRYLENQLALSFNVRQLERIDKSWDRILEGFHYKQVVNRSDISLIIEQVNDNMFNADRYSQDPFWSNNISSRRYVGWIDNLYKAGEVRFYLMIKNGKEVGFFAIKNESLKINSCPIAGIFNQYKYSGFIFVLVRYILEISSSMGVVQFITSISSNNQNLLSSFSKAFNFKVYGTHIVLRKIIEKR